MPRFICVNEKCALVGGVKIEPKVRLVFNEKTNSLEPKEPVLCQSCGKEMTQVKNETMPTLLYNEFDSMSPDQKREAMHKRSMKHFEKTDKGDLARHKKRIIDDNKRMAMGGDR